jgi:hypothetical protein
VYAGGEVLLVGDAGEQRSELSMFGLVEGLAQVAVVGSGDPGDLAHHLLPVFGEVQGVLPPVGAAAFAAKESAFLQLVDEADHPARQKVQPSGELLLAATWVTGNRGQQAGQRGCQPDLGDAVAEAAGGVRAELSQ